MKKRSSIELKTNRLNEYENGRSVNKFGVPHHRYLLTLENGTIKSIDVGYEEDWGCVQQCDPDDTRYWKRAIGWGNDADGHIRIVAVVDEETGKTLNARQWAKDDVWIYANCYSDGGCKACLTLGHARPKRLSRCYNLQEAVRGGT